jgi:adenosylcobinamide amidohydrolase
MDKLDFPGVVLPRTPEVLALYSQQLLTVLSSAVIGGGMVRVRYLLNRHVRHDYNCLAPGADLVAFARSQNISEAFVGQKAGVSLQKARTSIGKSVRPGNAGQLGLEDAMPS